MGLSFSVQALTPNVEIIIMLVRDPKGSGPLGICHATLVLDELGRTPAPQEQHVPSGSVQSVICI